MAVNPYPKCNSEDTLPIKAIAGAWLEEGGIRVLGKMVWLMEGGWWTDIWWPHYGLWSPPASFIRQETEPVSLSAFSLRSVATPCLCCFRWFEILLREKRKQWAMTDMSLHINTHSSEYPGSSEANRYHIPVIEPDRLLLHTCILWASREVEVEGFKQSEALEVCISSSHTDLKSLSLTHEQVCPGVLVKEERGDLVCVSRALETFRQTRQSLWSNL